MILFQVVMYTLFGLLMVYFVYTGIKKINKMSSGDRPQDEQYNQINYDGDRPQSETDTESETSASLYSDKNELLKAEALVKEKSENTDFDSAYLKAIEQGEKSQQFLAIGNMKDCAIIRSILFSEGIPSYLENQHINGIYGVSTMASFAIFSIKVYILVKDYDQAFELVSEYIKNLGNSEDDENQDLNKAVKTSATAAITGTFFSPVPQGASDSMGITILPKYVGDSE